MLQGAVALYTPVSEEVREECRDKERAPVVVVVASLVVALGWGRDVAHGNGRAILSG